MSFFCSLPNLEVSAVLHDIQLIISKIFMALAGVGDAAVGFLVEQSLGAVLEPIKKSMAFKETLEYVQFKLDIISPLFKGIEYRNDVLGRSKREMKIWNEMLEEGNKLVCKCYEVQAWNVFKRISYQTRLVKFDKKLTQFLNFVPLALVLREVQHISLRLQLGPGHYAQADVTVGVAGSQGKKNMMVVQFKVNFQCRGDEKRAMRIAAAESGVQSAEVDRERSLVSVLAYSDAFDPLRLADVLREKNGVSSNRVRDNPRAVRLEGLRDYSQRQ